MPKKNAGRVAARNLLRAFWRRHREVAAIIDDHDEGFWLDLEDTAQEFWRVVYTSEGAVVRKWPVHHQGPDADRAGDRGRDADQHPAAADGSEGAHSAARETGNGLYTGGATASPFQGTAEPDPYAGPRAQTTYPAG